MDKFWQALVHLLPPGFAFPRAPGSVVMRWLKAWAAVLREHHEWADSQVRQWIPHRTCSRMEEWEEALSLPDSCFEGTQDEEQRRTNMLARLRGDLNLAYEDSSAESPAAIEAYLARYGYQVEVWYSTPFRVGRNRVGDRLGSLSGVLNVKVLYLCQPFRVGSNRVGQRLRACTKDGTEIECLLARIAPARFQINVIYL
ncbi:putative phage tail protein [Burkholderia pseudomallei]|uniref:putative phage tail protein n=1 Tax=Burkholderia pseudomallei TaxID=28450 RepID=UPI000A1A0D43|nr:putative phage tail protein [Burkholderia pseudomallei]ARL92403.1 phage tail protein [Burkholderia pseudomallei]